MGQSGTDRRNLDTDEKRHVTQLGSVEILTGLRTIGRVCGLGKNVVRRMIADGSLPATYTSGRYRIAASVIAPFLAALAVSERSPGRRRRPPEGGGVVLPGRPLAGGAARRKKQGGKVVLNEKVPPQAGEAGRTVQSGGTSARLPTVCNNEAPPPNRGGPNS
jgi:hypothetical protein